MLGLKTLREKVESWDEPWKSKGKILLMDAYLDLTFWKNHSREIIEDINKSIAATEEDMQKEAWKLEVYRNTHNLCVYCGKPMTTTVFHDVPVCDEHKNK